MKIEVSEEPLAALTEYARIPIAFAVRRILELAVKGNGLGGFILSERSLAAPYIKDYDAIEGEGPTRWASRFDLTNWQVFAAQAEGRRVGGAVVARDTPGLTMLEERSDLAVLWDIRVATQARHQGVGAALFQAAERWAAARGCRQLKIETQNINLPACEFYERQGCALGSIHRFAYPELPDEVQLLWYKNLTNNAPVG